MFFVFWLPVLLLCFCRIPGQVSIMESKNHFNSAKIAIEQIAAHYDYVMGETIDHYTDNEAYKDLTVTNDNEEIRNDWTGEAYEPSEILSFLAELLHAE